MTYILHFLVMMAPLQHDTYFLLASDIRTDGGQQGQGDPEQDHQQRG